MSFSVIELSKESLYVLTQRLKQAELLLQHRLDNKAEYTGQDIRDARQLVLDLGRAIKLKNY